MSALAGLTGALPAAASADMTGGESVLFWILGPVMVVAALGLLFAKKAVHAALCMALVMVGLGIVYFAQQAPFLGSVQIFVYTGAVMMLFLFVLMLVGVDSSDSLVETIKGQRAAATLLGIGVAVLLLGVLTHVVFPAPTGLDAVNAQGNITTLATLIFGQYIWAFEVTGALLITAALGAMVLAHRERLFPKPTQRELAERRDQGGPGQGPAAGTGRVRAAQRRRHPRAAARRHPERAVGLARAHRPRPDAPIGGAQRRGRHHRHGDRGPAGRGRPGVGEPGASATGVGAHGAAAAPGLGDGPERATGAVRTRGGGPR